MSTEFLDINEIIKCLPQRYPFLMVDRVLTVEPGKSLTAIKNVSINEHFFVGHFPQQPIMPGVLIIESLAQACGVLAIQTLISQNASTEGLCYFAAIDNARFKRPVVPGDQLLLTVELLKTKSDVWKFKGEASVDGHLACSTEITSARRV